VDEIDQKRANQCQVIRGAPSRWLEFSGAEVANISRRDPRAPSVACINRDLRRRPMMRSISETEFGF
jgi:hypothetical protein